MWLSRGNIWRLFLASDCRNFDSGVLNKKIFLVVYKYKRQSKGLFCLLFFTTPPTQSLYPWRVKGVETKEKSASAIETFQASPCFR